VGEQAVKVQGPGIVVVHDWMSASDVFPHPPQKFTVEASIHSLSWCNKLLIHDAFSVKKKH
jgi:hypothetical protein